jgi:hypothetical protein
MAKSTIKLETSAISGVPFTEFVICTLKIVTVTFTIKGLSDSQKAFEAVFGFLYQES